MKQNKLKIAVTGGIGSGKSTVCEIIKKSGYPVFSCDEIYTELFNGGFFTDGIVKAFGDGALNSEGKVDKKKLSAIVFADEKKLRILNGITHPKIFERMFSEAEKCAADVRFFEVPVLFECGYEKLFDKVIVVLRREEERINSVMQRDDLPREKVLNRLKNQYNYNFSKFSEYYVIHNDGKIVDLTDKVHDLLSEIIKG